MVPPTRWLLRAHALIILSSVALGLTYPLRSRLPRHRTSSLRRATQAPAAAAAAPTAAAPVPRTTEEWQTSLAATSLPLQPTALSEGARVLRSHGVARFNGLVDPAACTALRSLVLDLLADAKAAQDAPPSTRNDSAVVGPAGGPAPSVPKDPAYVPGTRVRFAEAIDVGFAPARHDLLLPLGHPTVAHALAEAARALQPVLAAAAAQLPRVHQPAELDQQLAGTLEEGEGLEVVELAALLARPGARHQNLHGDYQRLLPDLGDGAPEGPAEWAQRQGKLPPRLVCFVCLQAVPTVRHGGTLFLPGTHTHAAHQLLYGGRALAIRGDPTPEATAEVAAARAALLACVNPAAAEGKALLGADKASAAGTGEGGPDLGGGPAVCAALGCGDCLVYDASVLHWGGANAVAGFQRAVLYFGVSVPGAAASLALGEPVPAGSVQVAPVRLRDVAAP